MLLVGLTGNYGMGKSIVLAQFENLGAITIDSDEIVASLLSQKEVLEKIRGILGNKVFDEHGHLNKKIVADLIFENDILRVYIEDLLHPLVFERIESLLETINNKEAVVVIGVPLLFERGYEKRFDRTITVFTDVETALCRLEKKGISRNEAMQRLQSQLPVDEKIKKSDFLINNNDTLGDTMTQVTATYQKLLQEASIGNNQRS